MSIAGKLLTGSLSTSAKLGFGGPLRRMATAGLLGGFYGSATAEDPAAGFVAGLGLGIGGMFAGELAVRGIASGLKSTVKSPWQTTKSLGKGVWGAGKMAGRAGIQAGQMGWRLGTGALQFSIMHPYAAGGLALGGYAAYSGLRSDSNAPSANTMAETAARVGSSEGVLSPVFRDSADGLTLGLHRGRHGRG